MTQLDTALRSVASDLIAKFGKELTVTYAASGVYNPATRITATTETTETPKGFVSDVSNGDIFVSGGLVKRGDKNVLFAAADLTRPEIGGRITIDSADWNIKYVKEEWSGDQVASYTVQVRK